MVFSSFPVYLDHPNLHQFQQLDQPQGTGVENSQLPLPPPPTSVGGGGGAGSIRPGSMVDRARLAKIPLPEAGLKCPRCDSTNTKFCYFNNYNLSQPRHFCKTCRRYWTRGGALRSVPVGGGCRRNKRNKSGNSSKSGGSTERHMGTNATAASPSSCSKGMAGHFSQPSAQLPFMVALQNLNEYGGVNLGSNIGGFQTQMLPTGDNGLTDMGFNIGCNLGRNSNKSSAGGAEQWKLPSMAGFEPSTNLFPFQSEGVETSSSMIGDLQLPSMTTSSSGVSQLASVKMEGHRELNLSKQFFGNSGNNQHWAPNTWAGFSGLSSSSTSHLL